MWEDPLVRALWASLAGATLCLALVLVLGRARRVRAHIGAVVAFLVVFVALWSIGKVS